MSLKDEVEEIQKKANNLEQNSFAMEILDDYKRANKRMFTALIIVLIMWFATIGYLVYTLNDIGTITTQEVEQENEGGNNNFIGGNGDING